MAAVGFLPRSAIPAELSHPETMMNKCPSKIAVLPSTLVVLVLFAAVEAPLALGHVEQAGPLVTPLKADNLDTAAFGQWVDGVETPMPQRDGPCHVVWTTGTQPQWDGVHFGDSKVPGPRHLRIGLKTPITVGSVLVRAGGQVSMLRPTAPYPGDLADESQWIPAEQIARPPAADLKTADEQYVLWVFPKAAQTRALRFTHTALAVDSRFAGWLGGAYVLAERMANVAPAAIASSEANGEAVARINDESNNGMWAAWDNGPEGSPQPVSPQHPVDVLLAWRQPVSIRALGALWAGFAAAEVQTLAGSADRPPREAAETDWRTVKHWEGLENQYPRGLGVNWLDLGQTLTTRAIRLRITQATKESHPHLVGKTNNGRRVWLGELIALPTGRCAAGGVLSVAADTGRRGARADPCAIHTRCTGLRDTGHRFGRRPPRAESRQRDALSRRAQHGMVGRHRRSGPRSRRRPARRLPHPGAVGGPGHVSRPRFVSCGDRLAL